MSEERSLLRASYESGATLAMVIGLSASVSACGAPAKVAPLPSKPSESINAAQPLPPIPPQASYCSRLQPLLDKTARAAELGTRLSCLDVPGITELGRYGSSSAGEEDALRSCFEDTDAYQSLVQHGEGTFQLVIDDAFLAETNAGGSLGLSGLIPWLPDVKARLGERQRVSAQVVIREARFVTLVGVASRLQGQPREGECLRALCNSDYSYVHKALVGVPSVLLAVQNRDKGELGISSAPVGFSFAQEEKSDGSTALTSAGPVTLAVARSAFRTPQTERLCSFCGKKGQGCCISEPTCDGGLSCLGALCVEVGRIGQPCDEGRCLEGACVAGRCEAKCGGIGQLCCAGEQCSGALKCTSHPDNALETLVFSENISQDGGFFGTNADLVLGRSNCGGLNQRTRYALSKVGVGRGECESAWWFDPQNKQDCRIGVHVNVSVFGDVSCQLDVYAKPPPKPNLCSR